MNKLRIILISTTVAGLAIPAFALHSSSLPQPQFNQVNFLRLDEPLEFNLDYALQWTDSVACLFIGPYDAVVLHVDVGGQPRDVFVISDIGMQRLTMWMCTEPDPSGKRDLLVTAAYRGDAGDEFRMPSGLATNAVNRKFNPNNDVVYVADRGNGRIVELAYTPDNEGGKFRYNRFIGDSYLEWPVDVAVSAYGDGNPGDVDLYVVDWGLTRGDGKLHRFDLNGTHEGLWHDILFPGYPLVIGEFNKPTRIACFPDSAEGKTAIYIAEEESNSLQQMHCATDTDPEFVTSYDYDREPGRYKPGGIALDDYGRVYAANQGLGTVQMFGPNMDYIYESFGTTGYLNFPQTIIMDTYHGLCEALILECYDRQSGLQSYIVDNGASSTKPPLGFVASGLVRPPSQSTALLPGAFSLNEAYPNPFNSRCLITFSIPVQSNVRIEIFNILGQRVATLMDEMRDAGEHSVAFDAGDLSSGIYFYTLKTDGFSRTKSMVLLK
jgi:sugar lactone lactonase YvrE